MREAEEALVTTLRHRMDSMLRGQLPYSQAVLYLRSVLLKGGWQAFLFGGLPRHLVGASWREPPRDVDVVVCGANMDQLASAFESVLRATNRFGGMRLQVGDVSCDMWLLNETWGFSRSTMAPSFENLPRTTFLNLEAVAVDLMPEPAERRAVHCSGFVDAILQRRLELNFEPNPYPEACVVRALAVARRDGLALGPNLLTYIASHGPLISEAVLADVQQRHFGRLLEAPQDMRRRILGMAAASESTLH